MGSKPKDPNYFRNYRANNLEARKASEAKWRANNRDLARARTKACVEANPERQRQSERDYRARHHERVLASQAAYLSDPENVATTRAAIKRWNSQNSDRLAARSARRRAARKQATPSWADSVAILAIYAEAKRLTEETGIVHEVDHIYPLQSEFMCGLHVETNLQILQRGPNRSKSNHRWPGMEWCAS